MTPAPTLSPLSSLRQAGRRPPLSLAFSLVEGQSLSPAAWLRILPGRRYVGMARWKTAEGEKTVLAKLFVGKKARRALEREKEGALALAAQGLGTPPLLAWGYLAGESAGWLLFEYLSGAETLAETLARAGVEAVLAAAVPAIAQLHARGLWQEDLHPGNLLCQAGRLYWIDGDGIRAERPGQALSPVRALDNFALFFAQLPLKAEATERIADAALAEYRRGNPASSADWSLAALRKAAARRRQARMRDWLGKIARDCSAFSVQRAGWRGAFGLAVVRREEAEALAPPALVMADPDACMARGHLCKTGNTATVARVENVESAGNVGNATRPLIVKRYNIKNWRHWLSRCWRPSRAWAAWREGNRLFALGICTAKPLAVIEKRCLWLRGRAWLVSECLEGEDAGAHLRENQDPPQDAELMALKELLAELAQARLSHGDLKASNLIWQPASRRWALIDLDAMRAHRFPPLFRRAHRRDRDRLLRNWPAGSPLRQKLAALLAGEA